MNGSLTLVATPIGNLGDITPRATAALQQADLVCCEDTRRTGLLLHHLGIEGKKYLVVNEHTEYEACDQIVAEVLGGKNVVLVTDAGTPAISDPGERVVRAAIANGIPVESAPGVSAVTMALAASARWCSTRRHSAWSAHCRISKWRVVQHAKWCLLASSPRCTKSFGVARCTMR